MPLFKQANDNLRKRREKKVATQKRSRRAYVAPRVVDFGAIELMTGDCLGLCLDGMNAGLYGWPQP